MNSSYDELGRLATVTDPAGRVYTHGYDPNGNRESLAHPNGAETAYGYDALNRLTSLGTRRLTDEAGNITDGYTYSAFGEPFAHTGSDSQPYAFTGEPLDPNSGFQYHRARWLDPRTGRFLAMDPFSGSDSDPATLHRYLYAGADPAGKFDPTGKFQTTALAVGGVLAVLAGLSFVACAPLRPPKTAGLYWKASPPADEAQETKRAALTVARTGIQQLGVSVTESAQADYRLQIVPVPGGKPLPTALGDAMRAEGRAEIFYFRVRTAVLRYRQVTLSWHRAPHSRRVLATQ